MDLTCSIRRLTLIIWAEECGLTPISINLRVYGTELQEGYFRSLWDSISIWDKSDPAVYTHPITDHWVKLKYQTPELRLTVPQSAPPYYSEKCSRFRYDGCLSSVTMSRISDYLIDEFTELKPGAYPASKPRIPMEFANPYQELNLSTLKYWMDQDTCGNLCPIARKKVT